MKPSESVGAIAWAFPPGDDRQEALRILAGQVAEMEAALVSAYEDSSVCPMCGNQNHRIKRQLGPGSYTTTMSPCLMTRLVQDPEVAP